MTTLDKVRALFEEGATMETVENTYRPVLNGSKRRLTSVGRTVFSYEVLDGAHAGEKGRSEFPKRARDVVSLTDDTVTYKLGLPASAKGDHTVTLRKV